MSDYTGPMETGAEESARMQERSDPWAGVRRRLKEEKELFGTLTLRGARTENLLSDADALLAAVRDAIRHYGLPVEWFGEEVVELIRAQDEELISVASRDDPE